MGFAVKGVVPRRNGDERAGSPAFAGMLRPTIDEFPQWVLVLVAFAGKRKGERCALPGALSGLRRLRQPRRNTPTACAPRSRRC